MLNAKNLSLAVVIGQLLVTLVAAVLWLMNEDDRALFVFTVGIALMTASALYVGKLLTEEERNLEERLAARDFRYRQTLELLPEGVVILGENNRIEWVNSAARKHLELTNRHVGLDFFDCVGHHDLKRWMAKRRFDDSFLLQLEENKLVLEVSVVSPDIRHTLLVTRDVTEKRRLEDMRRDFVANVSHELRTPLTVIAGFLDYANEEMPSSVREHQVGLMREQTARMRNLTDDLLMLAKLENKDDQKLDEPEIILMSRLVEDVWREGKALSAGRHVLDCRCERIGLIGFPDEIRCACLNLVSNAVRYTPEGGRITLEWKRQGTGAAFVVTDTGIGIAPEHIPRLTERFFRVDKSRARATGGTGLGLAIVKHILRRNHGELRVKSTPGAGSAFAFYFKEAQIVSTVND